MTNQALVAKFAALWSRTICDCHHQSFQAEQLLTNFTLPNCKCRSPNLFIVSMQRSYPQLSLSHSEIRLHTLAIATILSKFKIQIHQFGHTAMHVTNPSHAHLRIVSTPWRCATPWACWCGPGGSPRFNVSHKSEKISTPRRCASPWACWSGPGGGPS